MTLVLALFAMMLIPFAAAGLGLIHAGLGRSRSAAHALLATLCVLSVTAIVFVLVGFAWTGFPGGHSYSAVTGSVSWNWIGAGALPRRPGRSFGPDRDQALLSHLRGRGWRRVIAIGAGADRWRLGATCISSALFAAVIYPLFAHWVWGGGWLAELGRTFGLGAGMIDAGGSATIQAAGGLTALAIACLLGPRRGKYGADGVATAIPGHNIVLVLFGCVLALVGWTGLNAAGAMIFYAVAPGAGSAGGDQHHAGGCGIGAYVFGGDAVSLWQAGCFVDGERMGRGVSGEQRRGVRLLLQVRPF